MYVVRKILQISKSFTQLEDHMFVVVRILMKLVLPWQYEWAGCRHPGGGIPRGHPLSE